MTAHQRLLDWLDDLCVRFIVNAPHEELQSVERICFQLEEAQWFYEDFIRPLDPSLPSMNLRVFAQRMFAHCPLFADFSAQHAEEAYETFIQYKTRVPVRGAIMLNQEMTHAVLVKGWKKGAKWSFPRGKINKEEKDLDCAIREVYEETGFDLRASGLVPPENEVKSIAVNMHQQNVMLFVFRGIPMDTHFEPRTRKEISKIDWYKLGDLPHLRQKSRAQQGNGQDLLKDGSFYMVGPFIGQLKGWIKQQKRLDKSRAAAGQHLAPPPLTGATDTEELEVDLGETTADESGMPEATPNDQSFADLVAQLGRSHRHSDALPEVSAQPQPESVVDPAAELKRLLSVGSAPPSQDGPTGVPAPANPLLAMLHGSNQPAPPHTPFDQIVPTPQQPQSPHGQHHPRPPRFDQMPPPPPFPFNNQGMPFAEPQYSQLPPPPHNQPQPMGPQQFVPPPPRPMNQGYYHAPGVPQQFNQHPFTDPLQHGPQGPPASKLPLPKLNAHAQSLLNAFKLNEKPAISSPQGPSLPDQSPRNTSATPLQQQQPPLQGTLKSYNSPAIQSAHPYAPSPPAFQSPPPQANFQPAQPKPRNAHQDSLLSLFRSPSAAAAMSNSQKVSEPPVELSAHPSTPGYARTTARPDPGPPVPNMNTKPTDHLGLLQSYSLQKNQQKQDLQSNKPGHTSATVRGPVNAPDFDTVKRNAHHPLNGHSRGPSPAPRKEEQQKVLIPQQILKREDTPSTIQSPTVELSASATSSPLTVVPPTATFKPQILKRPQQNAPTAPSAAKHSQGLLDLFKSTSPAPIPRDVSASVAPASAPDHSQNLLNLFNGQTSSKPLSGAAHPPAAPSGPSAHAQDLLNLIRNPKAPQTAQAKVPAPLNQLPPLSDQRSALLSLFGKSSSQGGSPTLPSQSPLASASARSPMATSPIPPARSPQPPTPKHQMSGIISPVSPLPDKGSQAGSPANLTSRSRISSLGEAMPPNIIIPRSEPTLNAMGVSQKNGIGAEEGYISSGSGGLGELGPLDKGKAKITSESSTSKSPVDKNFLLGFLNDVARKGR